MAASAYRIEFKQAFLPGVGVLHVNAGPLHAIVHGGVVSSAISGDIVHFCARVLATISSEDPYSSHAPLRLPHPALSEVAARVTTAMIET